ILPSFSLPPLEFCFGTNPTQAEKSRPDRNAFGSATLATRAVASAGPTPGSASSRLLVSLDRCQAVIIRSNFKICALSIRSWLLGRRDTRALPRVTGCPLHRRRYRAACPRPGARPVRQSQTQQDGRGS